MDKNDNLDLSIKGSLKLLGIWIEIKNKIKNLFLYIIFYNIKENFKMHLNIIN